MPPEPQPEASTTDKPLRKTIRARVQAKLDKAAKALEEAVAIAKKGGWPQAEGFISGEGWGCVLHVFPQEPDASNSECVKADALEWQCGGW